MVYGYVRVSSRDQNEDRQMIAMGEADVPRKNIYMDKQSGKDFERPEYRRLLNRLQENDLLFVKSIDRLGRNYEEIIEQWRIITKVKRADIFVMDMPLLDTRRGKDLVGTFLADVVLQVLSFVAENERCNIRQRQAEGIAAAKKRGVRFGRPKRTLSDDFYKAYDCWDKKQLSVKKAAVQCGMPKTTFYQKALEYKKEMNSREEERSEK